MKDNLFKGKEMIRMKLTQELLDTGIVDIYLQQEPRVFKIEYKIKDNSQEAIIIPILEFPYPTVDQLDNLVDGKMDLETLTKLKGFIIVSFGRHWKEIVVNHNVHGEANEKHKELLTKKITKEDINFIFETLVKEAKHDKISIKQLFYGMASAFTMTVLHSNVNSKNAGAGKSYLLILVSDYFPSKYVLVLTGASDKAFQHREGIMVLEDKSTDELTEINPIMNKLRTDILNLEQKIEEEKLNRKDKLLIKELKEQKLEREEAIKSLLENAVKLIVLSNTIILLLDTPQDAITDNLMSVLSNDTTRDQKYLFTDKSTSGKIGAKYNILRGTPVMFSTRVIDDTRSPRFEEKNRRFINITPNVTNKKILDANKLITRKYGLVSEEYDEMVVKKEDKEIVKSMVSILVEKLKNHSKYLKPKESGVKIPFIESISIPNNDVWSMTVTDRMMRYLTIVTKVNMDCRPRLVRKDNPDISLIIATFEDFKETLELMERGASNIRPYIAEWYNDVFLPTFREENGIIKQKELEDGIVKENYVSVTSTQLIEKTLEISKISISNEDLRHKFIDPLINHGLIDKARSEIRKSENIYFPVDETGHNIFSLFTNNDLRLHVGEPSLYPCRKFIENTFNVTVKSREKYGDKNANNFKEKLLDIYQLMDADGTEITPEQLAKKYFSNPETCFIRDMK